MIAPQLVDAARKHWWLFVLRGALAVIFGVAVIAWPGATVVVLVVFIAAYALVDGVVTIISAFRLRPMFDKWWLLLVQGLVSATFGVFAIIYPGLSLTYIVVAVALWMLFAAAAQFMLGTTQRAMGMSSVWSTVGAVLSILLAVAAFAYPRLTIATVIALIAWFAIVIGIMQLVVAFKVKSMAGNVATA